MYGASPGCARSMFVYSRPNDDVPVPPSGPRLPSKRDVMCDRNVDPACSPSPCCNPRREALSVPISSVCGSRRSPIIPSMYGSPNMCRGFALTVHRPRGLPPLPTRRTSRLASNPERPSARSFASRGPHGHTPSNGPWRNIAATKSWG